MSDEARRIGEIVEVTVEDLERSRSDYIEGKAIPLSLYADAKFLLMESPTFRMVGFSYTGSSRVLAIRQ